MIHRIRTCGKANERVKSPSYHSRCRECPGLTQNEEFELEKGRGTCGRLRRAQASPDSDLYTLQAAVQKLAERQAYRSTPE